MPPALTERLGDEASTALLDLLEGNSRVCADYVLSQCTERFERRLVEETSKLRIEMAQLRADVRQEVQNGDMALRQEMHEGFAVLRQEMHAGRFELLKWAFVFWVGQLVSVTVIVGLLLRGFSVR